MTESEWLEGTDPAPMLEFLGDKASDRKLRLFAVACCLRIWDLIPTAESRECVLAAERYADRTADGAELGASIQASMRSCDGRTVRRPSDNDAINAVGRVHRPVAGDDGDFSVPSSARGRSRTGLPARLQRAKKGSCGTKSGHLSRRSTLVRPCCCERSSAHRSRIHASIPSGFTGMTTPCPAWPRASTPTVPST